MGSVSCIVVWACECYAFIRFYKYLHLHKVVLNQQKARYLRRSNEEGYPYSSTGQPGTAYLALAACLFILVVANGASLWRGVPHTPNVPGESADSGTSNESYKHSTSSKSSGTDTFVAKCFAAYFAVSPSLPPTHKPSPPTHTIVLTYKSARDQPICFILLWIALKLYRYRGQHTRTWKPKDLSKFGDFRKATSRLDRLRDEPIRI